MGTSNFNLREAVDNHVNLIQNQGALTGSDVKELTTHLLDATDELRKRGLSEEEAFLIASRRLGNNQLLSEEYEKVNPSLSTNKIWSYLFLGYNFLYIFPSIIFVLFGCLYVLMYEQFARGPISVVIISGVHILFAGLIIYIVKKKTIISEYIETQVRKNPLRILLISFIPQIIFFVANWKFQISLYLFKAGALNYPMRKFHVTFVEFTFYVLILSLVGGVLSLIFSLKKTELISLRTMFEKPSVVFLLSFGVFIELLSASTRVIQTPNILMSSIIFGSVYMAASYMISLYNRPSETLKYVILFTLLGFIMEVSVGVDADISRGNTYNTAFYSIALLLGVFSGWQLGGRIGNFKITPRQT